MRSFFCLCCFLFIFSQPSISQLVWTHTLGPEGSPPYSMYQGDDQVFISNKDFFYRKNTVNEWEFFEGPYFRILANEDNIILGQAYLDKDLFLFQYELMLSIDNGESWIKVEHPVQSNTRLALSILDQNLFIGDQSNDLLYKSSDLGENWKLLSSPFQQIEQLKILEDRLVILSSENFAISDDLGESWYQTQYVPNNGRIVDLWVWNENYLIYKEGGDGNISYSIDNGNSWQEQIIEYSKIHVRNGRIFGLDRHWNLVELINFGDEEILLETDMEYREWRSILSSDLSIFLSTTFKGIYRWDFESDTLVADNTGLNDGIVFDLAGLGSDILASTGKSLAKFSIDNQSWNYSQPPIPFPERSRHYSMATNGTDLVALGYASDKEIAFSNDTGKTWSIKQFPELHWYFPYQINLEFVDNDLYILTNWQENLLYLTETDSFVKIDFCIKRVTKFNDIIYATTYGSLFFSEDNGLTWQESMVFDSLKVDEVDAAGNFLFLTAYDPDWEAFPNTPILYSSLDGLEWRNIHNGLPDDKSPIFDNGWTTRVFYWSGNYYIANNQHGVYGSDCYLNKWVKLSDEYRDYFMIDSLLFGSDQGVFSAKVPHMGGCEPLSVSDGQLFNCIELLPNPAFDKIYYKTCDLQVANLTIIDNYGRVLDVLNSNEAFLDIAALNPGVYYLIAEFKSGGYSVEKFIKSP